MGCGDYERFLPKNQHTQRKLLNFENWVNGELSKSAKIGLSKSVFYGKNYPNLSQFFFIEEYQFRSTFFDIDIFLQHKYLNHLLNSLLDNYLTDIHSTMNYVPI